MKRNMLNFVVDVATALVMVGMIATGLVVRFVLPPGSGSRRILWGWGRHDWGDLHFWLAVAVGAVLVVHVALHWGWVCATVVGMVRKRGDGGAAGASAMGRNVAGAAFFVALAALLGGFVWAAGRSVTERQGSQVSGGADAAVHAGGAGEETIRGSMTLAEVAEASGVGVATVRERLGVPADTPADEQLGRLAKKHGLSMQQARQRLAGPAGK